MEDIKKILILWSRYEDKINQTIYLYDDLKKTIEELSPYLEEDELKLMKN